MAAVIKPSLKMTESDTVRMLRLYQTEPCLYDKTYSGYGVRELRMAAALGRARCAGLRSEGDRQQVQEPEERVLARTEEDPCEGGPRVGRGLRADRILVPRHGRVPQASHLRRTPHLV